MKQEINISYEKFDSADELQLADKNLLQQARETALTAYAPYSKFLVGAAALLANGVIITGTNQENASSPVGICAERVLLSVSAVTQPGIAIDTIAISYKNSLGTSAKPISPCGMCRQSLKEYEDRIKQPIRIILGGSEGPVIVLKNVTSLLPFSFGGEDLL